MAVVKKTVAANLPVRVSEVAERCRVVVKGMTGNTYFPSPSPTLAVFIADIDALEEAVVNAELSRSATIRDALLKIVMADVKRLVKYVQLIANANPDNAEVIINSSGFYIKRVGYAGVPANKYKVLSLETGRVILTSLTNKPKYPYIWEVSTNGTDWTILMASRTSGAECETLTSGQLYYFRYRIVGENNKLSMPSDVVSCMVK